MIGSKLFAGLFGAALVASASAIGCNSLLGINAPREIPLVECGGEPCASESAVCLFESCTDPCEKDSECKTQQRCLATSKAGGCVTIGLAGCESSDECPDGTVCSAGECRIDCSSGSGCLADQTCTPSGVCVGNDPTQDPGATCKDDELRCAGQASAAREVCIEGKWVEGEACASGKLCDGATKGECKDVASECTGHESGESFCDGKIRFTCSRDLVTVTQATCASSQHCLAGSGDKCAVCLSGEFKCDGNVLQECATDGLGFDDKKTCSDAPCSATAGDCTEKVCTTPGKKRCNGDVLEECNDSGSGYDVVETCSTDLCDPVALTCDKCFANTKECTSGGSSSEPGEYSSCSANGLLLSTETCDLSEPFCIGDGTCVECLAPSDCPSSECRDPTCGGNTCGTKLSNPGTTCQGSKKCDAAGACVTCLSGSDCPSQNVCRSGDCLNANAQVGGDPTQIGSFQVTAGTLYMNRLPQLAYPATLSKFGIGAHSGGASVKFALYAGTATAPNYGEAPIAITSSNLALANGAVEANPNTGATLAAGVHYWIGFAVNATVSVRYQAASQQGAYVSPYGIDEIVANKTIASLTNDDGIQYGAYIKIIYQE